MDYTKQNGLRLYFTLYVLSSFILIFSAMILQREYQDSWTLEDLFMQTLLFALTFSVTVVNIKDNRKLVFLIASFLAILGAIPNLKYTQIYGVFDPMGHYGFINRLISSGHVPESGFYSNEYSGTPGMQLLLSVLSLVTGLSTTSAIKFFLIVASSMSPFFVYYAIKNMFTEDMKSFILLALCFLQPIFFVITGRTLGLTLYLFFVVIFLRQNVENKWPRRFAVILIILGIALIISHGVTSLFLLITIFCSFVLLGLFKFLRKSSANFGFSKYLHVSFFLSVSLMAWWMYNAKYLFNNFLAGILESFFKAGTGVLIPSRFYQLSFYEQLSLVYVRFYDTCVVVFLSLVGFAFYLTTLRNEFCEKTKTMYMHILCLTCTAILIAIPFLLKFQIYTIEERFINYSMLLSPFFAGLALYCVNRFLQIRIKAISLQNFLSVLLILFVIISLLFVKFTYQPLLPRTGEDDYVVDYRGVNTVYQMKMIQFAEKHHASGRISSDDVTAWQIFGLTETSFHLLYTWRNPLYAGNVEADMILLHYSGASGSLNEPLEFRTKNKLNELKLSNDIIYDNGESFILETNIK